MVKRNRRSAILTAILLCLSLLLTACGSGSNGGSAGSDHFSSGSGNYDYGSSNIGESYMPGDKEQSGDTTADNDLDERKLIRTANIRVESKQYDEFLNKLNDAVRTYGGYMESINSQNSQSYYANRRESNMVIRIPAEHYRTFMNTVSEIGNVIYTSEELDDVTMTYIDIESHINALKTEEESLLRLMEAAENLSDLLTIQTQLTEVRYSIESYQSQLLKYDDLIAYSTINMTLYEVEEETIIEEQTMFEEIGARFLASCSGVLTIIRNLIVMVIGNLPYYLFIAAIIGIPIWFIIFMVRRSEKKHAKKKAEMEAKKTT